MNFIHLSDLHIGLRLYHYDLKEDQEYILQQIIDKIVQYRPDAVVIAGDVYDKAVPSAEAVQLFDWFMKTLTGKMPGMPVMVISGNHDSAQRLDCFRSILKQQGIYLVGMAPAAPEEKIEKVVLQDAYGEVNFYLLPFIKPAFVRNAVEQEVHTYAEAVAAILQKEEIDTKKRNVVVSHQFYMNGTEEVERMESEIVTVGNIDSVPVQLLDDFDYAALGHIHKPMKIGKDTVRYCGTPMPYSIGEAGQEKGMLFVQMKGKEEQVHIQNIPLVPLRQVRKCKGRLEELLMQPSDDYVSVILTDEQDLETVDMQERLRAAFPHLLEIRRETAVTLNYDEEDTKAIQDADPFSMFCQFFPEISEEEKEILASVVNTVKEG